MNYKKKYIGFWGYPHPEVIEKTKQNYPDLEFIDLDKDYGYPNSGIIPDAYCRIIRNIIDNSLYLKDNLEVILAAIGEEKCDSGRFASILLRDMGFNVIETRFEDYPNMEIQTPISKSKMKLSEKIDYIMDCIILSQNPAIEITDPTHGFWGVPPNNFGFLDLFPETTHIYGWIRCVEAKRPADMDLEMFVDENVPTVFYAQAFCSKTQLAKYLAKKHNGLFIDVDDAATNSVRAKVEAFIKLG